MKGSSERRDDQRGEIALSLSKKSIEILEELKILTDADSDSEVLRNAMRVHVALLNARKHGRTLYARDDQGGVYPVELFSLLC